MYDRILVPTDGSPGAERAVEHALTIAEGNDAAIHALYVVDTSYPYADLEGGFVDWEEIIEDRREYGRGALDSVAEQAGAAGVSVETELREDDPIHRGIIDYATENDIDLIVMGTHGRRGLDRVLLGSVTERVVRTSRIPVLTVRMTDDEA